MITNKFKENIFLIVAILLFISLTLPFINTLPYMDGDIDFIQTLDFYSGGINQYFNNWNTVHPPLKLIATFPFYYFMGISPLSYSILGIVFGILGIISIYLLSKDLFGKSSANLSAIFLSLYPLFISNSIFSMRDTMITTLITTALLSYKKQKMFSYALFTSFAVLTKETALLLPIIVIIGEIIFSSHRKKLTLKNIINKIYFFLPFLVFYIWKIILNSYGKTSWNEWIFADAQNKGVVFVILNNLISLNFINPYAIQHWKQLIFLNFNWIYLSIILLGLATYILKIKKGKFTNNKDDLKIISICIFLVITYLLTVLSLQTYTIPRYALPIIPFLIIGIAKYISHIKTKLIRSLISAIIILVMVISLFNSIDPIAIRIWGKTQIFNESLYGNNNHLAGNDGITYNMQYLLIARERSELIKNSKGTDLYSGYCRWIFPDPNNESKMINALDLNSNLKCNQIR